MKRFVCLIALGCLAGVPAVQAKTGLAHNTGMWEMTSSFVAMSDDGLVVEKERTETQCLDTGDAATFFVETLAPGNCTLKNYRSDATGLSADVTCLGGDAPLEGSLDVRLFNDGNSFGAHAALSTRADDFNAKEAMSSYNLFGRRTGDCPSAE